MGRLRAKKDTDNIRNAPILDNQVPSMDSSVKAESCKFNYSTNTLRRSSRLNQNLEKENLIEDSDGRDKRREAMSLLSLDTLFRQCKSNRRQNVSCGEEDCKRRGDVAIKQLHVDKIESSICHSSSGILCQEKGDYENLRKARILENQARLASLGLQKTISDLRSITSSAKSVKIQVKKHNKVNYRCTTLRRSNRLRQKSLNTSKRSPEGKGYVFQDIEGEEMRPANAPLVSFKGSTQWRSTVDMARRCASKSRGSVYDPIFGICCHFCRQKKLCGEEDCKRCGDLDSDQPCKGKTDCSMCHSSNGVLCRACLKVRYGEEMEEVRENKQWMCPHCIEEKGIRPYWICNSSFCLKKRKMVPTGIAIFRAREMGYASVAHLLMDELQQTDVGIMR